MLTAASGLCLINDLIKDRSGGPRLSKTITVILVFCLHTGQRDSVRVITNMPGTYLVPIFLFHFLIRAAELGIEAVWFPRETWGRQWDRDALRIPATANTQTL